MVAAAVIPIDGSLFDIIDHTDALFNSIELTAEGSEERAALEAEIYRYLDAEIRKVDNIAGYLAHCESQQEFAAQEMKRLQDRKRGWERKQERLESYIMRVMDGVGVLKLEGCIHTLKLMACPASVEVINQEQVPPDYLRVTVCEAVDKTAAKKAMMSGVEVPGLALVRDKRRVARS